MMQKGAVEGRQSSSAAHDPAFACVGLHATAAVNHAAVGTTALPSGTHSPPAGTEDPTAKLGHVGGTTTQPPSSERVAGRPETLQFVAHVGSPAGEKARLGAEQARPWGVPQVQAHCAGGATSPWFPVKAGEGA
jgi:hypothetical protein